MAEKIVHRAGKVSSGGSVSALCYPKPRPIDIRRESWTLRDDAVTCPACRSAMEAG